MLKQTTLIFAFIAVALGFTPKLEQSLFYFTQGNGVTFELFQTPNGIIAYSLEQSGSNQNLTPLYTLIDVQANSVTPVLGDIVTACGQGDAAYDRVHYNVPTQNLVYYCSSNNSLLIIDQDDYSVQTQVSANMSGVYPEAKLTSEGSVVAILLMNELYQGGYDSWLIKISLESYTVVNTIVFDHDLVFDQEWVYGYAADNKNNMFVVTYMLNYSAEFPTITQTLYQMTLIGNAYELTHITNFTNNYASRIESNAHKLYCVDQIIFMTIADDGGVYALSQQGTLLSQFGRVIETAHQDGSLDLYVFDSEICLRRYTVQGAGFTTDDLVGAIDMHIALGDGISNTLMLYIDPNGLNFNVSDAVTLDLISSASIGWQFHNGLMLTNTTYCMFQTTDFNAYLQIFNRTTRNLIVTVPIAVVSLAPFFYFNEEEATITFAAEYSNQVYQVDLRTGNVTEPFTITNSQCEFGASWTVMDATNQDGSLQLTAVDQNNCYAIVSNAFGQITFNPFSAYFPDGIPAIFVDYDTVSVYALVSNYSQGIVTNMWLYEYATGNFESPTLVKSFEGAASNAIYASTNQVVIFNSIYQGVEEMGVIDLDATNLTLSNLTVYNVTKNWNLATMFHDDEGNDYTILSYQLYSDITDYDRSDEDTPPGVFFNGQQEVLYGATNYTVEASAPGAGCIYFVADQIISSIGTVRFYNACSQAQGAEIHTQLIN